MNFYYNGGSFLELCGGVAKYTSILVAMGPKVESSGEVRNLLNRSAAHFGISASDDLKCLNTAGLIESKSSLRNTDSGIGSWCCMF
jgi:hypothetical protein